MNRCLIFFLITLAGCEGNHWFYQNPTFDPPAISRNAQALSLSPNSASLTATNPVTQLDTGLLYPRGGHCSIVLSNGLVLSFGGTSDASKSVEQFNPATNESTLMNPLVTNGAFWNCVKLPNSDKILILGGSKYTGVEIYDPSANAGLGQGTTLAPMINVHDYMSTATLLPDGRVAVVGGYCTTAVCSNPWGNIDQHVDLYDPNGASGQGSATAVTMNGTTNIGSLAYHQAVISADGSLLLMGGFEGDWQTKASVKKVDLTTGLITLLAPMAAPRAFFTATPLANGKVLIVGGNGYPFAGALNAVEIYDPSGGGATKVLAPLQAPRGLHTANLLPNGKVVIAGGSSAAGDGDQPHNLNSLELYDPSGNGSSTPLSSLSYALKRNSAVTLLDGRVMIFGGYDVTGIIVSQVGQVSIYPTQLLIPSGGVAAYTFTLKSGTGWLYPSGFFIPGFGSSEIQVEDSQGIVAKATVTGN